MVIHRPTSPSLRLALSRTAGDRLSGPLGRRLDDRFHYLRQVLAGGKEPIEAVVVGPGGTWALTLRARAGPLPQAERPLVSAERSHRFVGPVGRRAASPPRGSPDGAWRCTWSGRPCRPSVTACLVPPRGVEIEWDAGQRPGIQVIRDADALAAGISAGGNLTKAQVERIVALLDPRQPLPRLPGPRVPAEPRGAPR